MIVFWSIGLVICIYLLIRNHMVYEERMKMIEYYFEVDPEGYRKTGLSFREVSVPYDIMVLKFWINPISSFYPAYHASK